MRWDGEGGEGILGVGLTTEYKYRDTYTFVDSQNPKKAVYVCGFLFFLFLPLPALDGGIRKGKEVCVGETID